MNQLFSYFFLAIFLLISQPLQAQPSKLPDFSDSASNILDRRKEQAIGKQAMQQLHRQLNILEDPFLNNYLNHLGKHLAGFTNYGRQYFHFFIVDDNSINAFALPGGYIGVNSGLFLLAENESELAGVLSHEISHVTQRHIARMIEQMDSLSVPTLAAMASSIVLAAINPAVGSSALIATVAGAQQYAINFTRDNEQEADRIGIGLLAKSGFQPDAVPEFFTKLQNATRFNHSNVPEYLQTHPVSEQRISEARSLAAKLPIYPKYQSNLFALIKTRLRVLDCQNLEACLLGYSQAAERSATEANIYGHALSLFKLHRYQDAEKVMAPLIKKHADTVLYQVLLADIEAASSHSEQAIIRLKQQYALRPDNSALIISYVQLLLDTQAYGQASKLLKSLLQTEPDNLLAHRLMVQAANQSDINWKAYLAKANYLQALGDYHSATKQLKLALDAAEVKQDHYLQASFQAKLKDAEALELSMK